MSQPIIQISQLIKLAKHTIDQNLQLHHVLVSGELSNFTAHRSGHWYFSLKDESSKVNAVMFATNNRHLNFVPKDGDKVILEGSLSIFPTSGQLQFMATAMTLDGIGKYFIEFERRKKMLDDAGFFQAKYRKPLPKYPFSIGIIVGDKSAAQADIRKTIKHRWPVASLTEYPSLVQGESAPAALIQRCEEADIANHDVIIIARGGGSIEDLWAFNHLELVKTVFKMKTPIISGVGHEIDTTLVDYVADERAATPTAAAQLATPDQFDVHQNISDYHNRLFREMDRTLQTKKEQLLIVKNRPVFKQPQQLYESLQLRLDYLENQLLQYRHIPIKQRERLRQLNAQFARKMTEKLNQTKQLVQHYHQRQNFYLNQSYQQSSHHFQSYLLKLDLLSPLKLMNKGYALTYINDEIVKDIKQVSIGDKVTIRYKNGKIITNVTEKESINE